MTKREFAIKLDALITDCLESDLNPRDLLVALREKVGQEERLEAERLRAAASY